MRNMADHTAQASSGSHSRWAMPKNSAWAYAVCAVVASLLLLDSWVLGGGWWPEGEVTRRLIETARAVVVAFSLVSLVRRYISVWAVLVCTFGVLLSYELRVINTFALSAWLGLGISTLGPLMALLSVRPVRS